MIIVSAFQKVLDKLDHSEAKFRGCRPNKIWVDEESEFYKNSFKKWLKDNNIEMYSTHNERISVAAERFFRTLKFIRIWQLYQKMCILINKMIK